MNLRLKKTRLAALVMLFLMLLPILGASISQTYDPASTSPPIAAIATGSGVFDFVAGAPNTDPTDVDIFEITSVVPVIQVVNGGRVKVVLTNMNELSEAFYFIMFKIGCYNGTSDATDLISESKWLTLDSPEVILNVDGTDLDGSPGTANAFKVYSTEVHYYMKSAALSGSPAFIANIESTFSDNT